MHGWNRRLLLGGILLAAAPLATLEAAPSADELQAWIGELNDDDYEVREQAARKLTKAGPSAIEALVEGLTSDQAEVAWRSGAALEQIALEADEKTIDKIVTQLEAAYRTTAREGLKSLAGELHARQKQFRRDRAIAQIHKYGGRLGGPGMDFVAGDLMGAAPFVVALAEPVAPEDKLEEVLEEAAGNPLKRAPAEVLGALDEIGKALFKALRADKKDKPTLEAEDPKLADGKPAEEAVPDVAAEEPAPAPDLELAVPAPVAVGEIVVLDAMIAGVMPGMGGGMLVEGGLMQLALDRNWRGGDAALAGLGDIPELSHIDLNQTRLTDKSLVHLAKVLNLRQLNLYQSGLSRDGLFKFHRQRPDVIIYARGDAMMGIHGDLSSSPLVLTSIYEGSGAFEAGLLAGDVVHEIDGVKIRDFSELTIYVASKQNGDKIKVQFERDGKQQTADLILKPRVD